MAIISVGRQIAGRPSEQCVGSAPPDSGKTTEVAVVRHDARAVLNGESGQVSAVDEVSADTDVGQQSTQNVRVPGCRTDDEGPGC